jgi:hypothetical protein
MKIQNLVPVALFFGAVLTTLTAQAETTQFSAEMISSGSKTPTTGKMFVGEGRMRVETTQDNGQTIVRISDQQRRADWILFPAQKGYLERMAPADAPAPPAQLTPSAENDPCHGVPDMNCRRIGMEEVAGRNAIKWEMTMTRDGQTFTGTQWLDVERGVPLKYVMPNGQTMELKMLGTESLNGRTVEKWQMTMRIPDQTPVQTLQWFDPVLKLSIREEFPNGQVRELKNIQLGAQSDELFRVPADYTRLESPPTLKQ